jgi:hypothetical protein
MWEALGTTAAATYTVTVPVSAGKAKLWKDFDTKY